MNRIPNPKIQHYVPRAVLRGFCCGDKEQIWVHDKHANRTFITNLHNVASESHFYDFELAGYPVTLEKSLGDLEGAAAPIFRDLARERSIASLNDQQRAILAYFFSVQLVRTRAHREQMKGAIRGISDAMKARGLSQDQFAASFDTSEKAIKEQAMRSLALAQQYMPHFLDKTWLLFGRSPGQPFWTSDHPIALQNLTDRGGRGSLGIAVDGIEIYFPISSAVCLCMMCRRMGNDYVAAGAKHLARLRKAQRLGADMPAEDIDLLGILDALENGTAVECTDANMENINALQVAGSSRFVFSSEPDFRMAEEMLTEFPDLRTGRHLEQPGT